MLLVGRQAALAGSAIAAQTHCQVTAAESLLEAILVSGQASGLILVDVAPEIEHLEAGLRSLRRVNPAARIVLLCEPVDEALCRRGCGWGADDYEILPVNGALMAQLSRHVFGAPSAEVATAHPAEGPGTAQAEPVPETLPDLPAIPLIMQTEMLEEILAGAVATGEGTGGRRDLAARAVASLARHLAVHGMLSFADPASAAEAAAPKPGEFRRPVAYPGQAPFGTLIWQPASATPRAAEAGVLAQAAHWLGTMLALSQRYEQLRVMAITDELSGAYNRRYFMTYMNALLERSRENRSRITLLLFDIDDFKRYNDTFGHGSGDAIIRELIKLLRACTRPKDLVARVGGDEFAVVYWDNEPPRQPNSEHPKEILAATERFREAIKNHHWPESCKIKGTISISGGLASFPWDADTLESLMLKADEALLQAKGAGKNVIVLHGAAKSKVAQA